MNKPKPFTAATPIQAIAALYRAANAAHNKADEAMVQYNGGDLATEAHLSRRQSALDDLSGRLLDLLLLLPPESGTDAAYVIECIQVAIESGGTSRQSAQIREALCHIRAALTPDRKVTPITTGSDYFAPVVSPADIGRKVA